MVQEKAIRGAKKRMEANEKRSVISYDESDVYKPNAKKMP
jgi:hypothetical protein